MSTPKIYTAHDIERYHRGEMTAAEMYALERAALDDPMLAEALEGYLHTPTAGADLQILQSRLQQRLEEKKEHHKIFFLSNQWINIAALFVVIAGSGWLVFQTFSNRATNMVSYHAEPAAEAASGSLADSVAIAQPPPPLFSDSLQIGEEIIVSVTERKMTAPAKSGQPAASPQALMRDTDKNEKGQTATAADAVASDVALLKSPALANTGRAPADTGRHVEMAQQRADELKEAPANARMQSARARAAVAAAAEPEGGWQAFEKYVVENRKPVEAAKQKMDATRNVTLQFDIDKEGRPTNIIVTKSLCVKCDEEAVRLLKEGPKWKGTTGSVDISLSP